MQAPVPQGVPAAGAQATQVTQFTGLTEAPRYNIAPGQMIDVTYAPDNTEKTHIPRINTNRDTENTFGAHIPKHAPAVSAVPVAAKASPVASVRHTQALWGLLPKWAFSANGQPKSGLSPQINARSETAHQKPFFRDAFRNGRCLIPANGYYEWSGQKGAKQPYALYLPGFAAFAFAGIMVHNEARGVWGAALLTTRAHPRIAAIHGRMPVILTGGGAMRWLASGLSVEQAGGILKAHCGEQVLCHAVSQRVNFTRENTPELLTRVAEQKNSSEHNASATLFGRARLHG